MSRDVWEWDSLKAALEEEHQLCKGDKELQGKLKELVALSNHSDSMGDTIQDLVNCPISAKINHIFRGS
jgi:hypothetical protein